MQVLRLSLQLALHGADSLKARRAVVKSVKERLRHRFNVAIAEVGEKEQWSRADLAIVTVAEDRRTADATIEAVRRFLDHDGRLEVVDAELEWV